MAVPALFSKIIIYVSDTLYSVKTGKVITKITAKEAVTLQSVISLRKFTKMYICCELNVKTLYQIFFLLIIKTFSTCSFTDSSFVDFFHMKKLFLVIFEKKLSKHRKVQLSTESQYIVMFQLPLLSHISSTWKPCSILVQILWLKILKMMLILNIWE